MRARVLLASLVAGGGLVVLTTPSAQALSCVAPEQVVKSSTELFYGEVVAVGDDRVEVDPSQYLVLPSDPEGTQSDTVTLEAELFEAYGPAIEVGQEWLMAPSDGVVTPCNAWPVGEDGVDRAQVEAWVKGAKEPAGDSGDVAPLGPDGSQTPEPGAATVVPDEAWNAETNPHMADLAKRSAERPDERSTANDRSAGELAVWAGLGVLLGAGLLVGFRRRLS